MTELNDRVLFAEIYFDFPGNSHSCWTNIKADHVGSIIEEFLLSEIGKAKDSTPPKKQDQYTLCVTVDLSYDDFRAFSDCGNAGLRDGILLQFLRHLDEGKVSFLDKRREKEKVNGAL